MGESVISVAITVLAQPVFSCSGIRLHTGTSIFPLLKLSQILIFTPSVWSVSELMKIKILVLRSCLKKVYTVEVRGLKAN